MAAASFWGGERPLGLPASAGPRASGALLFDSRDHPGPGARGTGSTRPGSGRGLSSGIDAAFVDTRPGRRWDWRLRYVGRIDPRKGVDTAVAALVELPRGEAADRGRRTTRLPSTSCAPSPAGSAVSRARELRGAPSLMRRCRRSMPTRTRACCFRCAGTSPGAWSRSRRWGSADPWLRRAAAVPGEYLRDGENLLVIPADDAGALAAAVTRLAREPELRSRLVAGGRSAAQLHRAEDFDRRMVAELEAVAGPGASPSREPASLAGFSRAAAA